MCGFSLLRLLDHGCGGLREGRQGTACDELVRIAGSADPRWFHTAPRETKGAEPLFRLRMWQGPTRKERGVQILQMIHAYDSI
jgi:hypothetical protein